MTQSICMAQHQLIRNYPLRDERTWCWRWNSRASTRVRRSIWHGIIHDRNPELSLLRFALKTSFVKSVQYFVTRLQSETWPRPENVPKQTERILYQQISDLSFFGPDQSSSQKDLLLRLPVFLLYVFYPRVRCARQEELYFASKSTKLQVESKSFPRCRFSQCYQQLDFNLICSDNMMNSNGPYALDKRRLQPWRCSLNQRLSFFDEAESYPYDPAIAKLAIGAVAVITITVAWRNGTGQSGRRRTGSGTENRLIDLPSFGLCLMFSFFGRRQRGRSTSTAKLNLVDLLGGTLHPLFLGSFWRDLTRRDREK